MAYRDLKEFVEVLKQKGQLKEITEPVDPILEISHICDRVVKQGGPALLFKNPKGYEMPVLINTFGTEERMCLALECESLDALAEEVSLLLKPEIPSTFMDKVRTGMRFLQLKDLPPRTVRSGACQEIVETQNPSLAQVPIIKCWPLDGGRYITLPLVITRHPELGTRNIGMYRLQVFDDKTLGLHWQTQKGGAYHYHVAEQLGKRLEVAIALGPDPATIYAATAPLPDELDEMLVAGFIRKKPVEMVKCKTVDLEVPANSQIVLEGYCEPGERRLEGPFGDHQGYYSLVNQFPVFHLTAVTHQRDPIYPTIIVGPPPQEDAWLGKATERLFLPLIKMTLPEVVDMNLPIEGIFHNLAIISIKKKYSGHAKKVMHAVWGLGQLMFTKVVIIVDDDVNVQDLREVIWKVGVSFDPKYDVVLSEGPADTLDFAARTPDYGGKLGIDATRKWKEEGYPFDWPEECIMTEEVKKRVDEMWGRLRLD